MKHLSLIATCAILVLLTRAEAGRYTFYSSANSSYVVLSTSGNGSSSVVHVSSCAPFCGPVVSSCSSSCGRVVTTCRHSCAPVVSCCSGSCTPVVSCCTPMCWSPCPVSTCTTSCSERCCQPARCGKACDAVACSHSTCCGSKTTAFGCGCSEASSAGMSDGSSEAGGETVAPPDPVGEEDRCGRYAGSPGKRWWRRRHGR